MDQEPGLTNALLAKRLGRSRVSVTQYLNLLRLPDWIQTEILDQGPVRTVSGLSFRSKSVLRAAFQEVQSNNVAL